MQVTGSVALNNGPNLQVTLGYTPSFLGQRFTLIDNDGTDAVQGSFNGLPEGSLLVVGNQGFE